MRNRVRRSVRIFSALMIGLLILVLVVTAVIPS
jgi:hypothetical protein